MNVAALNPRQIVGQDSAELETVSRQKLAAWWNRANRPAFYPASDDDAVALVRSVEYSITREELVRFIDVGAFQSPRMREGRREWSATEIVCLATFLECRRGWMPNSELHDSKKTPYERELERYRASGEAHELFNDLEKYDLRALLLMLVEAENRQQREALSVALQIKLQGFEIIV
jgi:hypothetical protein